MRNRTTEEKTDWGAITAIDSITELWEIARKTQRRAEAAAATSKALIAAFKYDALEREQVGTGNK